MDKKKKKCLWALALLILLILAEVFVVKRQENRIGEEMETVQVKDFSSRAGSPDSRLPLNKERDRITVTIRDVEGELEELILFFFGCDQVSAGQLSTRLTDDSGLVLCQMDLPLGDLNQETFCQIIQQEEKPFLQKDRVYTLEVAVTVEGEDTIWLGSTLSSAKREIFRETDGEEMPFIGLGRSYNNGEELWAGLRQLKRNCVILDIVFLLFVALAVWGGKRAVFWGAEAGVLVTLAFVATWGVLNQWRQSREWYERYDYIAHAMGGIDGYSYTNSKDAFEQSYACGHKVFEVDFSVTSDGEIVLKHDWEKEHGLPQFENGVIPTREEFLQAKIWERYETMDIQGLLQLMLEHPEIYVVTDSKSNNYDEVRYQFSRINQLVEQFSEKEQKQIKSHMIVQIYNDDMYVAVEDTFAPENYLYTLYMRGMDDLDGLARFCVEKEIPVVTIPYTWWTPETVETLHSYGLKVWLHTLNTAEEIKPYRQSGVDGFYTDEHDPALLGR